MQLYSESAQMKISLPTLSVHSPLFLAVSRCFWLRGGGRLLWRSPAVAPTVSVARPPRLSLASSTSSRWHRHCTATLAATTPCCPSTSPFPGQLVTTQITAPLSHRWSRAPSVRHFWHEICIHDLQRANPLASHLRDLTGQRS